MGKTINDIRREEESKRDGQTANRLRKQASRNERERANREQTNRVEPSTADFGYGGHERGNEAADRVEREAYPHRKLRSGYSGIVGDIPTLGPGDIIGALQVLTRIRTAIEHGGWTRNEWRRLRNLEEKWLQRSTGHDKRFNHVGNRKGGLTREQVMKVHVEVSMDEIKEIVRNGEGGGK